MPENTLNLVEYLHVQQSRFAAVSSKLSAEGKPFSSNISLRYTFLAYSIDLLSPENDGRPAQYFRWKWNMDDAHINAPEIYCVDSDMVRYAADHFQPVSYAIYKSIPAVVEALFTGEEMDLIGKAERIASQAYMCNAGDSYSPGYFSEILLSSEGIQLNQINRWNSRSLQHNDDYSMRELRFFIPSAGTSPRSTFDTEQIGRMVVTFFDQSSANNKKCGDLIRKKINFEKLSLEGR